MNSLVGYGSDDDNETERFSRGHLQSVGSGRRKEDDTNYEEVNMDLSEESQSGESEPELPPAETRHRPSKEDRRRSNESRERDRDRGRDSGPRDRERHGGAKDRERGSDRDRERGSERDRRDKRRDRDRDRSERDRRSPRRDDKHRSDREARRGLLGDRPGDDKHTREGRGTVPALMDLKPFGGDKLMQHKSQDARDAVSPRFVDRDKRDGEQSRDRDRERGERGQSRDRDRERGERGQSRDREHSRDRDRDGRHRRSEERRSAGSSRSARSRSRGNAYPPPYPVSTGERDRRSPTSGEYRPSSYKVNKKLEVMEKMGLQIKTPDGSMTTAQQLRAAAGEAAGLPTYCNSSANRILDQVQKRKLLWSKKDKTAEEEASKWSGTKFAQDNDGRQVSKFMRLMGIKEPGAVKPAPEVAEGIDPNKKQEELFQAMQAQYEVARATTHTMRGVGLGFQRGQF